MAIIVFLILVATSGNLRALEVKSIRQFMSNAAFDAWNRDRNELLIMRKDDSGILQLYLVDEDARDPEAEMKCLSCRPPARAIGIDGTMIPSVHKGASDWHPSGQWFVTEMEIPHNISWKYEKTLPGTRFLAEPGAGWWNNLFLVKRDGSLWIRLTDLKNTDLDGGVLYPKLSADGRLLAWGERIGGAKPFTRYPFAQWVLKIARLDLDSQPPRLRDIRTHPVRDGSIFEPQQWSAGNRLLVAADIGYSELPYPAYRIDVWEATVDSEGRVSDLRNLTATDGFYEEQASYSPDEARIAVMTNRFDLQYGFRLMNAWRQFGEAKGFITRNLLTDLYLMDRSGRILDRITRFADQTTPGEHPLITRSGWSKDGKRLLVGLTRRSNITGKKTGESIYRIELNP